MKHKILKLTKKDMLLDSGEILKVNKEIILEYNLSENKVIDENTLSEIQYLLGIRYCYFLIARKDYLAEELKMKLKQRGIDPRIINKIMDKLLKDKYLDDQSYIKNYILNKPYSLRRIMYELSRKGVDESKIKDIYYSLNIDEKERILKYMKKVKGKDINKQISYLMRQGFEYEDIKEVCKN